MDWKQFISSLTSHLAWPTVAIVFIGIFKSELVRVIDRLARLKYKDLEMEFNRVKEQAETLSRELQPDSKTIESPVFSSLEEQILDAVKRAPSAAILLAWSGLESALAGAVARLAISPESPSYRSPRHNIEVLDKNNRLSRTHKNLLFDMREIRNNVAHDKDAMMSISSDQAATYATTAINLIKHFESYKPIP